MTKTVYKSDDWEILGHDYTYNLGYPYYAQHSSCNATTKGLMDWDHRKCYDCDTIVPDDVQTILYLLVST